MKEKKLEINGIPSLLFGDDSDRIFLYIHGKCGCKEEAEVFAHLVCVRGFQVLSFDLPEHGERKSSVSKLVPWDAVPELRTVLNYAKDKYGKISLYANSIGAYFSLIAYRDELFEKCLFVSPVLDMNMLINNMMTWANVSYERLQNEKIIETAFGETLSLEYYTYAKENPITVWKSGNMTSILYAAKDNLTNRETVNAFTERFGCALSVYEDGEHWFHTEDQLSVLNRWIEKETEQN